MNSYKLSRNKFLEIKLKVENPINRDIVYEFRESLNRLISDFDTSNMENRFIVGGVLEILFCALVRSLGFSSNLLTNERRYDIEIDGIKFSLKSNFTGRGSINLINFQGSGQDIEWSEPTMFFIGGEGIFYADPSLGRIKSKIRRKSDSLSLDVVQVVENGYKIQVNIPRKKEGRPKKIASHMVAKSLLEEIGSKKLIQNLPELID